MCLVPIEISAAYLPGDVFAPPGRDVAEFFATVGLPVHLGQLSLDPKDGKTLDVVVEDTIAFPLTNNMPLSITADMARSALLDAHPLGMSLTEKAGDTAHRRLHGSP